MNHPHTNGSVSPARACPGQQGMAVPAGVSDSGAPQRAVNPGPVARLCSGAAQDRGGNPQRQRDLPHLLVGRTAPASPDAPISDAGGFSEDLLTIARVERLILLTDAHKARRRHTSVNGIMRRLRDVTARLAGLGA